MSWQKGLFFLSILLIPFLIFKCFYPLKGAHYASTLPLSYPLDEEEEVSFAIVIVAEEGETGLETLRSVFDQNYSSYHVLYLCQSRENTVELFKEKWGDKIERVPYEESLPLTYYKKLQNLPDNEVVIHLEGGEKLAHEGVLKRLSALYQDDKVWLTYGKSFGAHTKERFLSFFKRKKDEKKKGWVLSPMKVYYAGLFKQLKLKNKSLDEMMLPMVEMAKRHIHAVPDILSISTANN